MLWVDRVRSRAYQAANVTARASANAIVVGSSETPRLSVRLSLTSVPTTLTRTTVSQYTPATYWRSRNWTASTIASSTDITTDVHVRPNPRFSLSRSAAVSPTVVHSTLMIQKKTVT